MGWIGVDLDATLAHYDQWRGIDHIGEPIPLMWERVNKWVQEGKEVRIFTARVAHNQDGRTVAEITRFIQAWCLKWFGFILPITSQKDFGMIELWDDRVIRVERNSGQVCVGCKKADMSHVQLDV